MQFTRPLMEELVPPYKSVRHIAIFKKEMKAIDLSRILNVSIYRPIGLNTDEISTLIKERRSKYFVRRVDDGPEVNYEVLERLAYGRD